MIFRNRNNDKQFLFLAFAYEFERARNIAYKNSRHLSSKAIFWGVFLRENLSRLTIWMVNFGQMARINRGGNLAVAFLGSRQICPSLRLGVLPTRKRYLNR